MMAKWIRTYDLFDVLECGIVWSVYLRILYLKDIF